MLEKTYKELIENVKNDILKTRHKVIENANIELINLYFRLGKTISENTKYGNKFIENMSISIKLEFPDLKGFSSRNLRSMKLFYEEYKEDKIWQQTAAKLPWGHNILLIEKIKTKEIRKIYALATIENNWSRSILMFQIDTQYHMRIGNSINNFNNTLPKLNNDLANNVIKDPYIFDFITLKNSYKEKELENAIITRIKDVLIELGNGFSFVGNQYKITVDNMDYYIDLLFYHLKLRCYIVVELKVNKFIPEYAGKMNFYLSAVDDLIKNDLDNPSIGLILCREKDKFSVEYTLKDINKPIGVSSYEISKYIPKNILESLPTEEELNLHMNIDE